MLRALIVDDEPIVREGIKTIIKWENFGFSICGDASNGAEGLEKIKELRPDLVVVDIKMPVMDGLQMIESLTKEKIKTKIIILTGYSYFEYARKALKFGVKSYLLKPIEEDELSQTIRAIHDEIIVEKREKEYLKKILDKKSVISIMDNVLSYIHKNLEKDLKLETLSKVFNYNSVYLGQMFKDYTGEYFNTYLDKARIEKAQALLKEGCKVYEAAEKVGFSNINYFCTKFKKYTGVSPSAVKNKKSKEE